MSKLPKTLFVKIESDSGTEYFVADADAAMLAEQGEKIKIGRYELIEQNFMELVTKATPIK